MPSQTCGCDPEAHWLCGWHKPQHVQPTAVERTLQYPSLPPFTWEAEQAAIRAYPPHTVPLRSGRQLEEMGAFVHGALAAFHLLGVIFNIRQRKWSHAAIHTVVMVYDIHSATKHVRDLEVTQ